MLHGLTKGWVTWLVSDRFALNWKENSLRLLELLQCAVHGRAVRLGDWGWCLLFSSKGSLGLPQGRGEMYVSPCLWGVIWPFQSMIFLLGELCLEGGSLWTCHKTREESLHCLTCRTRVSLFIICSSLACMVVCCGKKCTSSVLWVVLYVRKKKRKKLGLIACFSYEKISHQAGCTSGCVWLLNFGSFGKSRTWARATHSSFGW